MALCRCTWCSTAPLLSSSVRRWLGCCVLVTSFLEKQTPYFIRHCCFLSLTAAKMFITKQPKGYHWLWLHRVPRPTWPDHSLPASRQDGLAATSHHCPCRFPAFPATLPAPWHSEGLPLLGWDTRSRPGLRSEHISLCHRAPWVSLMGRVLTVSARSWQRSATRTHTSWSQGCG